MELADLKFLNAAIVQTHEGPKVRIVQGIDDHGPFEYGGYFGKRRITPDNFIAGYATILEAIKACDAMKNNA